MRSFSYFIRNAKIFVVILFVGFICTHAFAQSPDYINHFVLDPYNPEYVKNEILVKFKDEIKVNARLKSGKLRTGQDQLDQWLEAHEATKMDKVFPHRKKLKSAKMFRDWNGQMREAPQLFNIYRIQLKSTQDIKLLAEELSKDEMVEYAEPNYLVYSQEILDALTTNQSANQVFPDIKSLKSTDVEDPLYANQSYLNAIQIPQVWDSITGDSSQVIAILDTGVDWLHPDLAENIWINWGEISGNRSDDDNNGFIDDIRGWDFINNENNPMDDNRHGTHVAGIAAARGNNGIGIAGINWYAKIMPIKVFMSNGIGDAATISQGINYAAQNGATILNMSFGSYGRSFTMENALINAYITADLVASAGNDGESIYSRDPFNPTTTYPAALSYVLGVEANAGFSNYDPDGPIVSIFPESCNYELKAPGTALSTTPNGSYAAMSGTSMSAPMVSGAISLYRTQFPESSKEKLWGDLIHTSNGIIDVFDAFYSNQVQPEFDLANYAVNDTLEGNDQDGQADAGELIQIYATIRNTWGQADSVYALLSHSIYGDTNDIHLVKDSVFFGSLGTYGSLTNLDEPFLVRIDSNCFNNSNVTMNVTMKNMGDSFSSTQEIDFNIYNGEELSGILLNDITFTPDKLWIITNSLRISTGVTLTILPGTHIEIFAGIDNRGFIDAEGTADSMINVKGGGLNGNGTFKYIDFDLNQQGIETNASLDYCNFSNGNYITARKVSFCKLNNFYASSRDLFYGTDSIVFTNVKNSRADKLGGGLFSQCLFDNIVIHNGYYMGILKNCVFNDLINVYVFVYPNKPQYWVPIHFILSNHNYHKKNSFLNNGNSVFFVKSSDQNDYQNFQNQYWGTTDPAKIRKKYYDFMHDATLPYLIVDPILTAPSDSCPGHVWKVLVNGKDAQDEVVEPIGVGRQKFEVYFNRAMDVSIEPSLSFGVRAPFLQNMVEESASWSEDKKIWTAYYDVNLYTGDGIQKIRVADAKDEIGNQIPVEDDRFSFVIQAAGVQSMNFVGTPGIGKVALEWNNTGLEDFLGFNMYRSMELTDTTFSDPIIINTSLIVDTVYTDFSVVPDSTYHYYYKIVNTDLKESDSSNIVTATPFDAANGDANGDLSVNILDLTTIVSYILDQDPKPFLVDAADVNYDSEVNVLDIISIVQLIMGTKSSMSKDVGVNTQTAYLYQQDSIIQIESDHQIAVIQFELEGESLENVKLFSMLEGFEFSYAHTEDKIIGLFYSFNGNLIPEGIQDVLRVEDAKGELSWAKVFGGDPSGNYVNILIGELPKEGGLSAANDLMAFPNPFNHSMTIKYQIEEDAHVDIEIYNINGQKVRTLSNEIQNSGLHEIIWDGINYDNQNVSPGVYVCKLMIKSLIGNEIKVKEVKIMKTN